MNQREKFWLRLSLTMHDCHDGKVIMELMQETIEEVRSQFGLQLPKINKKIDHQQKTNRKAIRFLLIRN